MWPVLLILVALFGLPVVLRFGVGCLIAVGVIVSVLLLIVWYEEHRKSQPIKMDIDKIEIGSFKIKSDSVPILQYTTDVLAEDTKNFGALLYYTLSRQERQLMSVHLGTLENDSTRKVYFSCGSAFTQFPKGTIYCNLENLYIWRKKYPPTNNAYYIFVGQGGALSAGGKVASWGPIRIDKRASSGQRNTDSHEAKTSPSRLIDESDILWTNH
ncbi:hypothetical protein DF3PA_160071 [Candidatus Defluviicoccus seviourii]|uniref:Uncharacterized protein n=1 Tax=Candidatus Defluviicoccus seviourii TaxID=2565273 RepID=A0A564WBN4_9PROT|nr:hypothetical protein DF3PA_160071 [Candidatus Defluviicoccus seviourii]